MKQMALFLILFLPFSFLFSQKVGIGTLMPGEKLDVAGNIKADSLKLNSGGSTYDLLMKSNAGGRLGYKKGHGAQAINYIIATQGTFPNPESGNYYDVTLIGEIKLFAGTVLPYGWQYCHGQSMTIGSNTALFSLIGYAYGGSGNNFSLPDLRGAAPVSAGASPAGYAWTLGQKSN